MMPLTMEYLENCFNRAMELNAGYVAVRIKMEGFPTDEIIINPLENAVEKLAYYKKTYDEDLEHKFAKGISIVGFTFGKDFSEIEEDLAY